MARVVDTAGMQMRSDARRPVAGEAVSRSSLMSCVLVRVLVKYLPCCLSSLPRRLKFLAKLARNCQATQADDVERPWNGIRLQRGMP